MPTQVSLEVSMRPLIPDVHCATKKVATTTPYKHRACHVCFVKAEPMSALSKQNQYQDAPLFDDQRQNSNNWTISHVFLVL